MISGSIFSQNIHSNSLLGKISGRNLKEPSYIFGTFHMLCKNQYQLKPKVTTAIEKTKNFVMEINYSNPKELVEMQKMLISEQKLTVKFTEERITFSNQLEKFGYKLADVENI